MNCIYKCIKAIEYFGKGHQFYVIWKWWQQCFFRFKIKKYILISSEMKITSPKMEHFSIRLQIYNTASA